MKRLGRENGDNLKPERTTAFDDPFITHERTKCQRKSAIARSYDLLGGVDKFKPVSGSGEMDHAEEAIGQLVVAGGDGAVDLEVTEHALDAVALLIEHPVMFDLHATV